MCVSWSLLVQIRASLLNHTMNDIIFFKRNILLFLVRGSLLRFVVHKPKTLVIALLSIEKWEKECPTNNQVADKRKREMKLRKYIFSN
jgi:hypothetical protein